MPEEILSLIEGAGIFLSVSSVVVIVVGLLLIFGSYLLQFRQLSTEDNFRKFQPRFARVLIVALEILVVADVIETVALHITFESLATLGLLVIVRTWLSWTLELEAEVAGPGSRQWRSRLCLQNLSVYLRLPPRSLNF